MCGCDGLERVGPMLYEQRGGHMSHAGSFSETQGSYFEDVEKMYSPSAHTLASRELGVVHRARDETR